MLIIYVRYSMLLLTSTNDSRSVSINTETINITKFDKLLCFYANLHSINFIECRFAKNVTI